MNSKKVISSNKYWNSRIENNLKTLSKSCQIYSILHEKSCYLYKNTDLVMGLVSGFLTALTAMLITIPGYAPATRKDQETIIYSSVLFVSSFINFSQQFLSLKTLSQENLNFSKKYHVLYTDIKNQLSLYRSDRVDAKQFQLKKFEQFNDLIINQPNISYFVNLAFIKNKGIFIPLTGDMDSIDLEKESSEFNLYGTSRLINNETYMIDIEEGLSDDQLEEKSCYSSDSDLNELNNMNDSNSSGTGTSYKKKKNKSY